MERARTSGLAIAALVCGICSLVFFWVPWLGFLLGILAIVFAAIAMSQTGKDPQLRGRGMAIAGLVCAIVGIALWIIILVWIGLLAFWSA